MMMNNDDDDDDDDKTNFHVTADLKPNTKNNNSIGTWYVYHMYFSSGKSTTFRLVMR